jgi:hypothetical protein
MVCRNSQTRSYKEALCFEEPAIASGWTAKKPVKLAQNSAVLGVRVAIFRIFYAPWVTTMGSLLALMDPRFRLKILWITRDGYGRSVQKDFGVDNESNVTPQQINNQ